MQGGRGRRRRDEGDVDAPGEERHPRRNARVDANRHILDVPGIGREQVLARITHIPASYQIAHAVGGQQLANFTTRDEIDRQSAAILGRLARAFCDGNLLTWQQDHTWLLLMKGMIELGGRPDL